MKPRIKKSLFFCRYMLGLAGLPSLVQLVGFLFMPESPRWLLQKRRSDEARAILQRIRGLRDVEVELSEVRESCERAARAKAESGTASHFLNNSLY